MCLCLTEGEERANRSNHCTVNPGETRPDTDICVPMYVACSHVCKYLI